MKKLFSNLLLITLFIVMFAAQAIAQCPPEDPDDDGDGLCNSVDPCPTVYNPNPVDTDKDGVFNACDNCVNVFNPHQVDLDTDGIGDICDPCVDPDEDGVCNPDDLCEGSDDNIDVDRDRIPDGCDDCIDVDRDGICDENDDCIGTEREGEACDDGDPCTINDMLDFDCNCEGTYSDSDGDGNCDGKDLCPGSDDFLDYDGDGIANGCDPDPACSECVPDNEGKIIICVIPLNPDNLRNIKASCDELTAFFDKEGFLNSDNYYCGPCQCTYVGDVDTDGDGICDRKDQCPLNPSKSVPGKCGCEDQDTDGDGVCDISDECPGEDDRLDSDQDGIPDGCDNLNYCVPSADNTLEWIHEIDLAGITLNNEQSSPFYLHPEVLLIYQQDDYPLVISTDHIDELCELSILVLIDANNDGDFEDAGEELYTDRSLSDVNPIMNFDDLPTGEYRMRIILHYGRILSPCMNGIQGEVEDFMINLQEPQPCRSIYEGFEYSTDPITEPLDGGKGWSDAWSVETLGSAQIAIMSGSLESANSSSLYNQLGLLSFMGSQLTMSRQVDISLKGSNDLTFSVLIEPISGEGQMKINLGNITFGINELNQLFLGEQTGEVMNANQIYHLLIKAKVHNDGEEEIFLWMNPENESPAESDALQSTEELGDDIEKLIIDISGESDFIPFIVILDEINLGCDQNFTIETGNLTDQPGETGYAVTSTSSSVKIDVWPNPANHVFPSIILQGSDENTYSSKLFDMGGKIVWKGQLTAGFNSLPTHNLADGLYHLITDTKMGKLTNKIIINY